MLSIPKYYWKTVFDPSTKSAIAFVTYNNPLGDYETIKKVCERNICEEVGWVKADQAEEFKNPEQGSTICCEVPELRKLIPHIPNMNVENVLEADFHSSTKPVRRRF